MLWNDAIAAQASVSFFLHAPLCSAMVPLQYSIDNAIVGVDTLVVGIAGVDHATSRAFVTTPGIRALGAGGISGSPPFAFASKSVTLAAGAAYTDTLELGSSS